MEIKILHLKDRTIGNYTFKEFDIVIDFGFGGNIPMGQNQPAMPGDIYLRDNQLKYTKNQEPYIVAKQFKLSNQYGQEYFMTGTRLSNEIQKVVLNKVMAMINTPQVEVMTATEQNQAMTQPQPMEQPVQQVQQPAQQQVQDQAPQQPQQEIDLDSIKF